MNFRLQTLLRAGPEALLGAARTQVKGGAPSMRKVAYVKRPKQYAVQRQNPVFAPNFTPKGLKK